MGFVSSARWLWLIGAVGPGVVAAAVATGSRTNLIGVLMT